MPHKKAFGAYLRSGDDDGLRGLVLEGKAMASAAVAAMGGYLVDPQTADSIRSMLVSTSSLRAIANVVQIDATSFDVLIDRSEVGSGWATEAAATAETATPTIERISIKLHELSAMPKASQRLLDDSAFDVEGWLAGKIATRFIRAEASAFINSTGVDQPKGILPPTKVANASWSWGNIGYIPTGAAADAPTNSVDCIISLVYALTADYRANASFIMNSKTAGAVRKMKDADGRFMWSDGLAAADPTASDGLSCADLRGHARYRGQRLCDCFRRFQSGLHHRRTPRPAYPARPVLGQAERAVLRLEAREAACHRFCRDQTAENRGVLTV